MPRTFVCRLRLCAQVLCEAGFSAYASVAEARTWIEAQVPEREWQGLRASPASPPSAPPSPPSSPPRLEGLAQEMVTIIAISSSVGLVLLIGCSLAFAMSIMRAARRTKYELSMEMPLAEEAAAAPVAAQAGADAVGTGRGGGGDGSNGGGGVVVVEEVQLESSGGMSAVEQLLRSGSIKMTLAPVVPLRASSTHGRGSMLRGMSRMTSRGSSSFPPVDATSGAPGADVD